MWSLHHCRIYEWLKQTFGRSELGSSDPVTGWMGGLNLRVPSVVCWHTLQVTGGPLNKLSVQMPSHSYTGITTLPPVTSFSSSKTNCMCLLPRNLLMYFIPRSETEDFQWYCNSLYLGRFINTKKSYLLRFVSPGITTKMNTPVCRQLQF